MSAAPPAAPFVAIVPARLASLRLPRKALARLGGKTILARVLRQCALAGARRVWAAVDCDELAKAARAEGFEAVLTGAHSSGGERVAAATRALRLPAKTIVVNAQGDEPFLEPRVIAQTAALLASRKDCVCASACRPPRDGREFLDAAAVKAVQTTNGRALYFSRAPLPRQRDGKALSPPPSAKIHIGIYACRAAYWQKWTALPPAADERVEKLEQLRILANGDNIALLNCKSDSFGIDTPADLARARRRLRQQARIC